MTSLRVVEPGLFTTIQDLGRPHAMIHGIQAGGAMDRFAHRAANRLAGNDDAAATLECTVRGPVLEATAECNVAIAGGDFQPRVNGDAVPMWTSIRLAAGDRLDVGRRHAGARAYVAVTGGFAGQRWLGSLSTNVMVGRGGMEGRALAAGDAVQVAKQVTASSAERTLAAELRPDYSDHRMRVIEGPQFDTVGVESQELLFGSTFSVGHSSDRMGYRLDGSPLESTSEGLLSFVLVPGAVQLPPGGRLILMMADHQTVGGYPVIVNLIGPSLSTAAQLAPGDELTFMRTTADEAARMRAAQRAALDSLIS